MVTPSRNGKKSKEVVNQFYENLIKTKQNSPVHLTTQNSLMTLIAGASVESWV
jgi:hypothetical protein